jgi:hypothetical protein
MSKTRSKNRNKTHTKKHRSVATPSVVPTVARRIQGIISDLPNAQYISIANAAYNRGPSYAINRQTLERRGTLIPTKLGVPQLRLKKNKIVYPLIEGAPYALPYSYSPDIEGYVRLGHDDNIPAQDYDNPGERLYGSEFNDIQLYVMNRHNKNQMFSPKNRKVAK